MLEEEKRELVTKRASLERSSLGKGCRVFFKVFLITHYLFVWLWIIEDIWCALFVFGLLHVFCY